MKKVITVSTIGRPYIIDISDFKGCVCRSDKSCFKCKAYVTTMPYGEGYYTSEDAYDICAFGHIKEFNPDHTTNEDYKKEYFKMLEFKSE